MDRLSQVDIIDRTLDNRARAIYQPIQICANQNNPRQDGGGEAGGGGIERKPRGLQLDTEARNGSVREQSTYSPLELHAPAGPRRRRPRSHMRLQPGPSGCRRPGSGPSYPARSSFKLSPALHPLQWRREQGARADSQRSGTGVAHSSWTSASPGAEA